MEVKYKRDLNRNFMVLKAPEKADYQLKMICDNEMKGFLKAHTKLFNGEINIYYDITSKQPLSRLYANKELGMEDIKSVLFSIQAAFDEAKKYLLDCNGICLNPDFCYLNPENKKVEWLFYPVEDNSIQYTELAEFFIEKVNHNDAEAVDAVYGFFRKIKDESFVIGDYTALLAENKAEHIRYEDEITVPQVIAVPTRQEIPLQKEENEKDNWKYFLMSKLQLFVHNLSERFPAGRNKEKSLEPVSPPVSIYQSSYEWESYEGENISQTGETMVIEVNPSNPKRVLRSLDKGSVTSISLDLPCVIGKMAENADVILKDKSISRIHAKIFSVEEEVYLQDLNSTNGTYLNDVPLESNEMMKLSVGDEIAFGTLRFRYE